MKREKLTSKQDKVFRFLAAYFAKHQRMPTIREVSEHMGFASIPPARIATSWHWSGKASSG